MWRVPAHPATAWTWHAPRTIEFGRGRLAMLGVHAAELGKRLCLVRGGPRSSASPTMATVRSQLGSRLVLELSQEREPTVEDLLAAQAAARDADCDGIVGVGGGAVLDLAKALAGVRYGESDPRVHLEVVGDGRPLPERVAPWVAVPTTAGTGSEATRNAVLSVAEKQVKVSLRSPRLLAQVALVDPALTDTLSPKLTASTGLDALTQLLEPAVSRRANPWSDGWAFEGLARIGRSLVPAVEHPTPAVRDELAFASLLGGLALGNSGLGAVHGLAAPLGGIAPIPHGVACALLLGPVTRHNVVTASILKDLDTLARYESAAQRLGAPIAELSELGDWLDGLAQRFAIAPLRAWGVRREDFAVIVERARRSSSMQGNPVELSAETLHACLEESW